MENEPAAFNGNAVTVINMKAVFWVCIFTLLVYQSASQELMVKSKAVFFELGGSGGIASLNFEKQFSERNNTRFAWRTGISVAPVDRNSGTGIILPVLLHALTGKAPHRLDLGIGQGITVTTKGSFYLLTTACAGYRYQKEESPWFYRLAYTPLISWLEHWQVQHWGGISIGYTF